MNSDQDLIDAMIGPTEPTAAPGFFTDRFGVRTRTSYLPPNCQPYTGQVGSRDGLHDMKLHETEELMALLRSVADARGSYVIVELGAGWGPFVVLGGTLAKRRGLRPVLVAVEGSSDHFAYMHTHLHDNGFDPAAHQLFEAVIGTYDGVAQFPKIKDPTENYGAQARFESTNTRPFWKWRRPPAEPDDLANIRCMSLKTLLDATPPVDLLHVDIQGAEGDVVTASIDTINAKVRRMCIGTHSREVEGLLFKLLPRNGWTLDHEAACQMVPMENDLRLYRDGIQVWRNERSIDAADTARAK